MYSCSSRYLFRRTGRDEQIYCSRKRSFKKEKCRILFHNYSLLQETTIKIIKEKGSESPLLNISERDEELGYKHVFQTDTDVTTIGGKIRGPVGMWNRKELHIDNNVESVIEKLKKYYN